MKKTNKILSLAMAMVLAIISVVCIAALDLLKDIDYEKGLVRINKAYAQNETGEYSIKNPKTESGNRIVVLPEWACDRLKKYACDKSYTMYTPEQISELYKKIRVDYNLNCSFHGLRHYYASIMLALGVPDKYAMERMGHSTNNMLKRYQESIREKEIEIDKNMLEYLDKLNE